MADSDSTTTREDAQAIAEDLRDRMEAGEITDREALIEAMHKTVDGCGRVTYTAQACEAVCEFGTDAYTDRFGEEGLTRGGAINWGALAYCIVEDLAWEALDSLGIDPNAPFACLVCEDTHESAEDARACCEDEDEDGTGGDA